MAFGKRREAGSARLQPQPSDEAAAPAGTRLELLRDQLQAVMDGACKVADAVRLEGSINMPRVPDELDAEAGPLTLKSFHEHFCMRRGNAIVHALYAYATPDRPKEIDPNAQHQLQELAGRILSFNLYCQRAHLDEALGVALQSPRVPAVVDTILVRSAFFTAFFDNLVAAEKVALAGRSRPTAQQDLANVDRYLLMARDKMLAPETIEALVPAISRPFIAVETEATPHAGDYFINGVYFPADLGRILLATAEADKGLSNVA